MNTEPSSSPPHGRTARRVLWIAAGILVFGVGAAALGVGWQARAFLDSRPSDVPQERVVQIPRGAGPLRVGTLLHDAAVVTDAQRFAWYLRASGAAAGLREAELRFRTDLRPAAVVDILLHAPEVTWPVTFPEGLRIEEMASALTEAGLPGEAEYIRLARDAAFIGTLDLGVDPAPPSLEGLLLPETYAFRRRTTAEEILRTQVKGWKDHWDERRMSRAKELGRTPYEWTVLASVVEKETGLASERPLIAGVFHNRLRRGMRLESDPTIIYGLTDYDGNIRKSDIRRPHPWNTYVIAALPPTPIAGPGRAAIDAVLWPDKTDAIFFVASGGGGHHFSSTYAEHAAAVDKYQRRR